MRKILLQWVYLPKRINEITRKSRKKDFKRKRSGKIRSGNKVDLKI